jgi:DNA-3-methyladenine glycosylase II
MDKPNTIRHLSGDAFHAGLQNLIQTDPDLQRIVTNHGPPPLWARDPGFPTLVHIILEQQVSLASARAAYDKLSAAAVDLSPERFLRFDDGELRSFGFSRQKAGYCRGLAQSIVAGLFDLEELLEMDDGQARSRLMQVKGIGPWTADIYLLMALRRPDIWPTGDLALAAAVQQVKHLPDPPDEGQLHEIAAVWQPWRAVAARILWHLYLS